MSEFINTADLIGDDEMCDQIIMRTVTEYKEDRVTKIGDYAFYGCTELANFDCPNVTAIGGYAFQGCSNLEYLELPKVTSVSDGSFFGEGTFNNAKVLLPSVSIIPQRCFAYSNIRILDLRDVTSIGGYCFVGTRQLRAIIIRNTSVVPTMGDIASTFQGIGFDDVWFYVPKTMDDGTDGIAAYEAATNWSALAGNFRYIEDYTIDGTLTGELDETKI